MLAGVLAALEVARLTIREIALHGGSAWVSEWIRVSGLGEAIVAVGRNVVEILAAPPFSFLAAGIAAVLVLSWWDTRPIRVPAESRRLSSGRTRVIKGPSEKRKDCEPRGGGGTSRERSA